MSELILEQLCEALGWQGGTIHDAIAEVRKLKAVEALVDEISDAIAEVRKLKAVEAQQKACRILVDEISDAIAEVRKL